jgi:RNA polymerase sigma-70 factor (ECF subfamily)
VNTVDFSTLYKKYANDVLRFALYLSGSRAQAEDITSETFVRAWVARERIRQGTAKAYLLQIARNLYRMQRRTSRTSVDLEDRPNPRANPEEIAASRGELRLVLSAIQRLPEIDRAALVLRASDGLSYDQIGIVLGISPVAARVKVHRARLLLNELLSGGKTA